MPTEDFHKISESLKLAWTGNDMDKTFELCQQYLDLAEKHSSDWNYGNAIHQSNIFLGLISLREGRVSKAKEYLMAAGQSKGSPQLKTFGPDMELAKQLLELGENAIVLKYLDQVQHFWWKPFSYFKLRNWQREIKKGRTPKFGSNLTYFVGLPS